ncbi:hypothetical protein DRJ17_04705 [Candidatus Woesearchaeota archaeon]|nr:MAG: hypothetical protein DRJ17_04705 [Candidatus Woesearchaeota archaeon]
MNKRVINLTPHEIRIVGDEERVIPSSGIARCGVTRERIGSIPIDGMDVPVNRSVMGEVTGLPDPAPGTAYIVSRVVAEAVKASDSIRDDIYVVDETIRDDAGRIVGCKSLAKI